MHTAVPIVKHCKKSILFIDQMAHFQTVLSKFWQVYWTTGHSFCFHI